MFLSNGDRFQDVSLISGTDDTHDGRSFAVLDYDDDGWVDIALMGLNAPRFRLLRNRMGDFFPERSSLSITLRGSASNNGANPDNSNRDAIGAVVDVVFENGRTMRLHRQAGQGFASQNSASLRLARNPDNIPISLAIRWPSGRVSKHQIPENERSLRFSEPVSDDSNAGQ